MPRPHPYAGAYLALRIDDRRSGRELLRRLIPLLDPVTPFDPGRPVSLGVGLSFAGLKALGVPEESLASFAPEFQQGMAARAADSGTSGRTRRSTGRHRWGRRTSTSWWPRWPGTPG